MQNNSPRKIKVIIAVLVVVIIGGIIANISINTSRSGKVATTVEVLPEDATITVDGNKSSSGTIYLTPGSHTFVATKSGFEDAKTTLTISPDNAYVGLAPNPISTEARKWAEDPDIASELERIGGEIVSAEGSDISAKNPIINYLPESNIEAPYTISYSLGVDADGSETPTIIIKNSTPDGRTKALKWIIEQGFDPADLTIMFEDFQNPLESGD